MKSIVDFILESNNKFSTTGKKKFVSQVDKWIKNIDEFYQLIGTSKGQDHWDEVRTQVWNFLDDSGILSMDSNDQESNLFVDEQIIRLCDALDKLN